MRKWYEIHALTFLFVAILVLSIVGFAKHGWGQEALQGRGLICDTKEQVVKAVTSFDRGENGVETVNKDEPRACGILVVTYTVKGKVGEMDSARGKLDLVLIEVVAVMTGSGWQRVQPLLQVTAMPQGQPDKTPSPKPSGVIHL